MSGLRKDQQRRLPIQSVGWILLVQKSIRACKLRWSSVISAKDWVVNGLPGNGLVMAFNSGMFEWRPFGE